MSRIFGPVIQQGYIVPDVKEAAKHWIAIGVGPFFLDEGLTLPGTYKGEKHEFGITQNPTLDHFTLSPTKPSSRRISRSCFSWFNI
ncbi:MAG: hypothetical protein O2910_04500 [Proteobacteria bacterium]|nr:hypothetical protein [Pseudomonadota bacterium]